MVSVPSLLPGCPQGRLLPQAGLWAAYIAPDVPDFFAEKVGTGKAATPRGPGDYRVNTRDASNSAWHTGGPV